MEMCKKYAALFAFLVNAKLIKGYYRKMSGNLILMLPLKVLNHKTILI